MFKVIFSPRADKEFARLPKDIQLRVDAALFEISDDPMIGKLLRGSLWGLRSLVVGKYTIVYREVKETKQIEVIAIPAEE